LIPATENRPGNNAYVPEDIIKMYDGTTVEVLNTDAEGRMILADALAYAKKFSPQLVIDLATLTGAAVVAVGEHAVAVMGNDAENISNLKASGFRTWEKLVELPLWDEYGEQLKSTVADMKNIGGKYAGAITAGKFLEHFTGYDWIHLDIAGPAFSEKNDSYRGIGGTGAGVRLLFAFFNEIVNNLKKTVDE
jgi:leucyl aminopeptidase